MPLHSAGRLSIRMLATSQRMTEGVAGASASPAPNNGVRDQRPLLTKTAWSAAASISSLLGTFVTTVIAARVLSAEENGRFAYCVWLATFFAIFFNLGVPNTLSRFLAEF